MSLVAFAASPASAHSVSGVGASNFRTELHTVNGQVRGLHVAVVEAGSRLEVVNRSGREAVVLGYSGEPYLRVGPDGVFQNIMSPAAYMNASRNGMAYVPDDVNASATPQWRKVSSEPVARWHDHRIHWMGGQKPPAVLRDPGHRHVVIPNWVVPIRLGTSTVEVTGSLVWVPGPSALVWVVLALLLGAGVVVLGLRPEWFRVVAVATVMLLTVDVFHSLGVGFAASGSLGTRMGKGLFGNLLSLPAWVAGGLAVAWLVRRRPQGLVAAAIAAALVTLVGGFADLSALSRSQVPFALPTVLVRLTVAASIGIGAGVFVAAFIAFFRTPTSTLPDPVPMPA